MRILYNYISIIYIKNLIYYFFIYFNLINLMKFYNCWINFIIILITINYLDWFIYYNLIIKLIVLILFKSIYY